MEVGGESMLEADKLMQILGRDKIHYSSLIDQVSDQCHPNRCSLLVPYTLSGALSVTCVLLC